MVPTTNIERTGSPTHARRQRRSRQPEVTAAPGRLWVLVAAVLVPLVLSLAGAMGGTATGPAPVGVATGTAGPVSPPGTGAGVAAPVHVVHPGETMWTIARDLSPDGDVRSTVDRLVALNGTADLQVGQRLRLS